MNITNGRHLYTAEDVAARLNLHVKTIRRFIREGKLPAKRIGKQYRITRAALDEFAGTSHADEAAALATRRIIVSSIVDVDAIGPDESDRITALMTAGVNARRGAAGSPRVDSLYDANASRLRVMITANPALACDLVRTISALAEGEPAATGEVVIEL
ncbi:MAG TPA: helix-turn-helix domain-containing protein [Gemmatimonadaceae bacterium]|nr:helix-turn-helix domain-containing protein [Gemmatimonadaceae bacterium]